MLCCRVFTLILLMLFTACATCAILFPQFRRKTTASVGSAATATTTDSIFFWYNETTTAVSGTTYITRYYSRLSDCSKLKTFYLVQSALSVAGAGFGGLACLFTACWTSAGKKRCLGGTSTLLCFLAFACCAVALALSAYSFKGTYCGAIKTLEEAEFKIVEGFGLIAAAAGGFLIATLFELIAVCCSCCC